MNIIKTFLLFFFVFSYGCSSKYVVTFDSDPQGASLICSGKNWGHTPKKLYYDKSVKKRSTINVSDCSANWVSGVRKSYPSYLTIYPEGGTITTVSRPRSAGYSEDARYNLQLRQTEAAESSTGGGSSTAKACKKMGDFSGRVYYFKTVVCPIGYF
jgi:hypothetical protein